MLTKNLKQNIQAIQNIFHNSQDLIVREFVSFEKINSAIIYLDGSVDKQFLISGVVNPLQKSNLPKNENIADYATKQIVAFAQVKTENNLNTITTELNNGFCVVLFNGSEKATCVDSTKWPVRAVSEPPTSAVINGPREGFVEDVLTNVSLLRKRLKNPNVIFEKMEVGKYSKTQIRLCYISGIADPQIVQKIRTKINQIQIDGIIDSSYVATFLEDRHHSIFRQVGSAEKPDIIASKILEGRVAIIVDGSPIVLTLPFLLIEDFQNSNDYYSTSTSASFLRWLRFFGATLAIILPGCYVAVMLYHYKLIPIKLLISIANSIQGIPLSPFLEILFIIFLFEMLYEASLRMPRYLGLALSVVGALILGDTAVKAGLISPPAVMIVALTGVMSYTVPNQSVQISLLRIIFTILGGVLGLYGIIIGGLFLVGYLCSIENYTAPYLAPFGPFIKQDQKDSFFKKPVTSQEYRPQSFSNKNKKRLKKWKKFLHINLYFYLCFCF